MQSNIKKELSSRYNKHYIENLALSFTFVVSFNGIILCGIMQSYSEQPYFFFTLVVSFIGLVVFSKK